ncbi:MAG TPA: ATP-binding protein, partial [Methanobacterium sp.]|nr:ATP-binding protein [Methanobacterium sp.]
DGMIIDSNQSFEQLFGYTHEETIGHTTNEIGFWLTPEDRDSEIEQLMRIGKLPIHEVTFGNKSGDQINGLYSADIIQISDQKYIFSTIMDITERKKAEEALKDSEKKLKILVDNLPVGVSIINKDREIIYENPSLGEILNLSHEEFLEKKYSRRKYLKSDLTEVALEEMPSIIAIEEQTPVKDFEIGIKNEDETTIWTNVSAIPLPFSDWSVLIVTSDITKRKQAEERLQKFLKKEKQLTEQLKSSNEELIQIQKELRVTIEKLETSNAELEQFAYVASHDLQEPLRMVSSFTQLLEKRCKDKLDEDAEDYIGFIVDGAQRMKDLIDDLLTFSRLTTYKKEFRLTDLNQVLYNVLANLQSVIEENEIRIIKKEPLPNIKCDSSQISQLFQNLISNAIKFHGDEPIRITINAISKGNKWEISVSDNGIGIEPEHQEKIFEIFKRLHTREEYEGTGIGLAICKRIVERHGGRIWVESKPGKGTTFYFTINEGI